MLSTDESYLSPSVLQGSQASADSNRELFSILVQMITTHQWCGPSPSHWTTPGEDHVSVCCLPPAADTE